MRAIEIDNLKQFTTALFARDTFDGFLVTEASFSTITNITIDGHINQEFMGEADLALPENKEKAVYWKKLRPLCYEIVKGQKVPLRFKIVFMMPSDVVLKFLDHAGLDFEPVEVNALFLNVNFQEGKLTCTTGTSMKAFSLDKSLEDAWDSQMVRFLNTIQ
ncbi:MAG: hypothetical protein IKF93_05250 [Lachnospiraceae bacterium]|nr:hypothetical protein [Lachnospiraceae bacterium]